MMHQRFRQSNLDYQARLRTLRRFATLAALAILGLCCVSAFGALSMLRRRLPAFPEDKAAFTLCTPPKTSPKTVEDRNEAELIQGDLHDTALWDKGLSSFAQSTLRKKDPSAFANLPWWVEPKEEDAVETNADYSGLNDLPLNYMVRSNKEKGRITPEEGRAWAQLAQQDHEEALWETWMNGHCSSFTPADQETINSRITEMLADYKKYSSLGRIDVEENKLFKNIATDLHDLQNFPKEINEDGYLVLANQVSQNPYLNVERRIKRALKLLKEAIERIQDSLDRVPPLI